MASKLRKRCLILLVMRELQIKTAIHTTTHPQNWQNLIVQRLGSDKAQPYYFNQGFEDLF